MDEKYLTPRQKELLKDLRRTGFIAHRSAFGRSQQNRPLWKLVELGLADFDWGPPGSFLQVQGFFPRRPVEDAERG